MKRSIGLIEYRSIAKGIEAADAVLKSGNVQLVQGVTLCPGKYVAMITGEVGAVEAAIRVGREFDPATFISSFVIPSVHDAVIPALTATTDSVPHDSLGVIETADAASAIVAADEAAKSAQIDLLEIRLARGLGGKGVVYLCGALTAVQTAVKNGSLSAGEEGMLLAATVIAAPSPGLIY